MKFKFTRNQVGIAFLSGITGLIHLVLLNLLMGKVDVLFTLNGLGFLALAFVFLFPIPFLKPYHRLIRWIFLGYTLITILVWVIIGDKSLPGGLLGYFTKLVEVGLAYLVWRAE
jgi:hypothetical protein